MFETSLEPLPLPRNRWVAIGSEGPFKIWQVVPRSRVLTAGDEETVLEYGDDALLEILAGSAGAVLLTPDADLVVERIPGRQMRISEIPLEATYLEALLEPLEPLVARFGVRLTVRHALELTTCANAAHVRPAAGIDINRA